MDQNSKQQPQTPEQIEKQRATLNAILRSTGALFMLGGTAIGFDLGSISTEIFALADPLTQKIFGGILFMTGVFDFFVLPVLLAKKNGE